MAHKKRIFLTLSIILFAAFFMLTAVYLKRDQLAFKHCIKKFTDETLSTNALSLHYTLKDPSQYGIYKITPLPAYAPGEALDAASLYTEYLKRLCKTDPATLTQADAFAYRILQDYLEETLALEQYPYYAEPLTPNSGVHTTLPILLAEYTFYDEDDISDYFEILSAVPSYLDGILIYETEKANAGLFMNNVSLKKVADACQTFSDTDNPENHMLATSFNERLNTLASHSALSLKDIEKYTLQNLELLKNDILPAYKNFAGSLTSMSSFCNNSYSGLCTYENGKEYYLALLKRNTGSYRSISDIKEMLYADFEKNYTELVNLLSENPHLLKNDTTDSLNSAFPLNDASDILAHLQSAIKEDFPHLKAAATVTVKPVSKGLESYCSPAFYLTVPMDAYEKNTIYINGKNALSGIDLYTTLAHEGFPGHLYQTIYFHLAGDNADTYDTSVANYSKLLRNTLYFGGYTEGYALYVENLSYDWAAMLFSDPVLNSSNEPDFASDAKLCCDVFKYERQMQIGLYCLLDIAIHYDGATYEEVAALLHQFGITDEEGKQEIYQYILEEPTTYLKYYLGYLEIVYLKNLAKTLWQDEYSDLRFHTFLLDAGPCNFKCLSEKLLEEE